MPPLDQVELLSVAVLLGPIGKGTSPGACRVAANNAAECGPSRNKTLQYLVRDFPLAGLLLVFRVSSLITPCFCVMQLNAAAFR